MSKEQPTLNSMRTKLLTLICLLFIQETRAQGLIGIHFIGSAPMNTFCDSMYRPGFGVNMEGFSNNLLRNTNLNKVGLRFGASFDVQGAGSEKRKIELNTPNSDPGTEKFNNTHVGFHVISRLTFFEGAKFTPYMDGFVGLRGFYSQQTITADRPISGYETTTNNSLLSVGTQRAGGSLGLMYHVNSVIAIDSRITYSMGTEGRWLHLDNMKKADGFDFYANYYSKTTTDLFMYHVGITFKLNPVKRTNANYQGSPAPVPNRRNQVSPTSPTQPRRGTIVTPNQPNNSSPKKPLEVKPKPAPAPKPKPAH